MNCHDLGHLLAVTDHVHKIETSLYFPYTFTTFHTFPISRSRSPLDSRRQSGGGDRSGKSSMRSDEKEGGDKDVRNRLGSKNGSRDERGDRENRTTDERAG